VLVVEQNEGGGGDRADAPGAEADPAQRLEGRLEQGVAAFGRGPGGRVQQVDGALIVGQRRVGALLDRRGQRRPLAFVGQVCQGGVVLVGPLGQQRQRLGVGAQRGGVVLAAGPDRRRPQRPAVRGGNDLHVAAVAAVLARPPQVHPAAGSVGPGGRAWNGQRSVRTS